MADKNSPKNRQRNITVKTCNYKCSKESDYNKHLAH